MYTPEHMKYQCQQHVNNPVQLQVNGYYNYEGIIESVDDHNVYLMVPVDEVGQQMNLSQVMETMNQPANHQHYHDDAFYQQPTETAERAGDERYAYPYPGYGYQPYPFNPAPFSPYGYGYYPRPYRWNRLVLPLAALTALAVL